MREVTCWQRCCKCVKDATVAGFKASFGLSIPRGEPVLCNIPGVSRRVDEHRPDEVGVKAFAKERADFSFTVGGTVFIVDSTSSVALPYGITAKATRYKGVAAALTEEKKRLEYKHWCFGAPNEFIPFALDNTGMLSSSSLRFLQRMKLHAKRVDRFRGLRRFWEALSIGLIKGSAHGFALMAQGDRA